jgi:hypothetical protein
MLKNLCNYFSDSSRFFDEYHATFNNDERNRIVGNLDDYYFYNVIDTFEPEQDYEELQGT